MLCSPPPLRFRLLHATCPCPFSYPVMRRSLLAPTRGAVRRLRGSMPCSLAPERDAFTFHLVFLPCSPCSRFSVVAVGAMPVAFALVRSGAVFRSPPRGLGWQPPCLGAARLWESKRGGPQTPQPSLLSAVGRQHASLSKRSQTAGSHRAPPGGGSHFRGVLPCRRSLPPSIRRLLRIARVPSLACPWARVLLSCILFFHRASARTAYPETAGGGLCGGSRRSPLLFIRLVARAPHASDHRLAVPCSAVALSSLLCLSSGGAFSNRFCPSPPLPADLDTHGHLMSSIAPSPSARGAPATGRPRPLSCERSAPLAGSPSAIHATAAAPATACGVGGHPFPAAGRHALRALANPCATDSVRTRGAGCAALGRRRTQPALTLLGGIAARTVALPLQYPGLPASWPGMAMLLPSIAFLL